MAWVMLMGYGHVSKVVDHHHHQYSKIIHGIFNKYSKTVYDENIYITAIPWKIRGEIKIIKEPFQEKEEIKQQIFSEIKNNEPNASTKLKGNDQKTDIPLKLNNQYLEKWRETPIERQYVLSSKWQINSFMTEVVII